MTRPIELWYWPTPNGWKISIALEEMGLAYEMKPVNIGAGEQFAPGFQAISPNGRMPAIVDPDGPGGEPIAIFESGAILQYLGAKSGRFYPSDPRGKAEVDQWLFWQVGGLGPMLGQNQHFSHSAPQTVPYAIERFQVETQRLYGVLNHRLGSSPWLGGDHYSIADIAAWPWVNCHVRQRIDLADYPAVHNWYERIKQRPATAEAMLKIQLY